MGDYLPKYRNSAGFPLTLTGTVTGGRIVTAAGATAGAGAADFIGVASKDGVSGDRITVYRGGIQRLIASGSIAKGARVKCAASGAVSTFTAGTDAVDLLVGVALTAAADAAEVEVEFTR